MSDLSLLSRKSHVRKLILDAHTYFIYSKRQLKKYRIKRFRFIIVYVSPCALRSNNNLLSEIHKMCMTGAHAQLNLLETCILLFYILHNKNKMRIRRFSMRA